MRLVIASLATLGIVIGSSALQGPAGSAVSPTATVIAAQQTPGGDQSPSGAQPSGAQPSGAQPGSPQPGTAPPSGKIDVDIDLNRGSAAWWTNPIWLAIGGLAIVVLILMIAMMMRGSGTTIVKE